MNKRAQSKYPLLVGLLAMLGVIAGPTQADNIQRSCAADYQIFISRAVTASNMNLVIIGKWGTLGATSEDYTFTARRGCGRTAPNRCRQRASAAALQCMQAHTQSLGNTPSACRSNGVQGYRVGNMQKLLQESVCRFMGEHSGVNTSILPKPYYVDTTIRAYIHGYQGCGGGSRMKVKRELRSVRVRCPVGQ